MSERKLMRIDARDDEHATWMVICSKISVNAAT